MTIKYLTISRTLLMSGVTRWFSIDNKISYHFTNTSHEWCHKMIKYWQPNILPFHELFSWVVSQDDKVLTTKYLTISLTLLMSGFTRWLSIDNQISYHFIELFSLVVSQDDLVLTTKYFTISRTLLMSGVTRWLNIDNKISYHFTNSSRE